jgi:hypothetical protein
MIKIMMITASWCRKGWQRSGYEDDRSLVMIKTNTVVGDDDSRLVMTETD